MVKTIIEEKFAFTQYADGIYFNGKVTALDLLGPLPPGPAQGEIAGYTSGGRGIDTIDKFSFTSDGNATDVGNLYQPKWGPSGTSSSTHGYTAGGYATGQVLNYVEKFSFAAGGNSSYTANLVDSAAKYKTVGVTSEIAGHVAGGYSVPFAAFTSIQKFVFASDTTVFNAGSLSVGGANGSGHSSTTSGYVSGMSPVAFNTIDKFPFATDSTAIDIGNLTISRRGMGTQSSASHGYTSGAQEAEGKNTIDKFSFTSDGNATDVGDLSAGRGNMAGTSSLESGYNAGGIVAGGFDVIDKFPFATDSNAANVGNLTQGRYDVTGQQV
jgi:hypothetical protein